MFFFWIKIKTKIYGWYFLKQPKRGKLCGNPIVQMMILGYITSELLFKSLKNSCIGRQLLSPFWQFMMFRIIQVGLFKWLNFDALWCIHLTWARRRLHKNLSHGKLEKTPALVLSKGWQEVSWLNQTPLVFVPTLLNCFSYNCQHWVKIPYHKTWLCKRL